MPSKVKKKEVEECFTCPLCTNLFDRPTTISECLHTFCRNCIHDKLMTERLKYCPVCNVDLGVFPLDKLRSDYSLEDMMRKIFPPKTKSVKAGPETVVASLKSSKKKEKPLTSLLASSPRVSLSPDAPLEPNVVVEEKQSEKVEALPRIQTSAKPIITFKKRERKAPILKKNDSGMESEQPHKEAEVKKFQFDLNNEPDNGLDEAEASTYQNCIPKEKDSEKDNEAIPVLFDLCKSLSDAKEVAPLNINDTPVIVEPVITSNGIPISGGDTEEGVDPIHNNCVVNTETEEVPVQVNQNSILISSDRDTEEVVSGQKLKNNGKGKKECATSRSRKKKGKKQVEKSYSLRPRKDGRTINPAASTPEAAISVEAEQKVKGRNNPVWFSLVPARTQNKDLLLPPISARYLRVKDRNMTVSYVKKYLMVKLGLESEDQVEIWLRDEPVSSSQTLHNLVDWWVQTTPLPKRKSAMVGSSAADFVMVLYYSFKSEFSCSE